MSGDTHSERRVRRVRAGQPKLDSDYRPPIAMPRPTERRPLKGWRLALFLLLVVAVVVTVRFTLKT